MLGPKAPCLLTGGRWVDRVASRAADVPRIRDLGRITLYRTGSRAETTAGHPVAGPLLTRRLNTVLIAENWDEMLRVAASLNVRARHRVVDRGQAVLRGDRQNTLAAALKEYGPLRRAGYAARYLARKDYRRKISQQLNKGREHARTAPRRVLRPRRRRTPPAPAGLDRAGLACDRVLAEPAFVPL
ncbi:MAG TPA: Tn3 family transposase, partial [Frankiaceae bacterium]|nr:Tn3 family transposase [Frankiaceae bacterium]